MAASEISFGTDGWRGPIADTFTFANVRIVTRAIARYLEGAYVRSRPVLVGYDTRFLADRFAYHAAQVLVAEGWKVLLTNTYCPTPTLAFSAALRQSAGALMFTASHNPATDCGLKYIPDYAGPATNDITDAIVGHLPDVSAEPLSSAPGSPAQGSAEIRASSLATPTLFDPRPTYLDALYSLIDVQRIRSARLRVTYDALYGASRGYLDEALRYCGCQVYCLHDRRDVLFGGAMPEPKPQQLQELCLQVPEHSSHVGMATDGDSDRFGIVDERGKYVTPNSVMLVLIKHLVEQRQRMGAIVRTVGTTHLLDRLASRYSLDLHETPVGFKHIGQVMRNTRVLLGGEESGGLSVLGHIPEKDGILANLLVAEAIAYAGKPLSHLVSEAWKDVGGPTYNHRIDLRLTESRKQTVMVALEHRPPQQVAGVEVAEISFKDGVKLYLRDGSWVLVRPSGTEPLLRISMEAGTKDRQQQLAFAMNEWVDSI
ncbi:MAG: phosphoglucomutase/phosphomannomutase family protein [Cyanobacteria bacterium P01_A01_bin.3]